ncbi:MYCBP-associated protein-like [Cephus cinctus]|uniref:MYCBP-associated protein-like n=1 Tax=Cephus cinctus TaxID=211228 RepID=A0AAJ7RQS8_CEPCN|nr:MYCBP-associated protein-like [Cephus cinctus]
MDHGRKIKKPPSHSKMIKNRSLKYCTAFDPPVIPIEPVIEDRRLINWKKWLSDRNKHYDRYKSISGRHQTNLIMNSSDTYRPIVEMRDLMDCATISVPATHDKYRGNPAFFKMPNSLSNHNNDCLPDVFVTLTKRELNILPEPTYVALPSLIEEEKNVVSEKKCEPSWRRSKYLQKREEDLAKTISMLRPSEEEVKGLIIKGEKMGVEKSKKFQRLPVIAISEGIDEEIQKSATDRCESVILQIQERELIHDKDCTGTKDDQDSLRWNLTFETACGNRSEDKIVLENKGTVVVEYQWREELSPESIVPLRKRKSSFYFNKNNGLILPGQKLEISIWFCTNDPGVHLENWRLDTDPKLHKSSLLFRFCGYASSTESTNQSSNAIEEYLDDCIKRATIREIINDLINSVKAPKSKEPIYNNMFLSRDLFVAKNPLYYYHSSIVNELKAMYDTVRKDDWPPWNFSLTDLRAILLNITNPNEREETLLRFGKLIRESLRPNVSIYNGKNNKYTAVYNILCSFANKFERESEFVRTNYSAFKTKRTLRNDQSDTSRSGKASTSISTQTVKSTKRSSQTLRIQETSSSFETRASSRILEDKNIIYGQMYFVRIYGHLEDAIDQACAMIDSLNNLNEFDK